MRRQSSDSSVAKSVGYDPQTSVLEIEFPNGTVWQYFLVPERVYKEMMVSKSIGKYFNDFIKGKYPEKEVRW